MTIDTRKKIYRFEGTVPSKKNSQTFSIRSRMMVKSPQYRKWHDYAVKEIRRSGVPQNAYNAARLEVVVTFSELRRRDLDNIVSSIADVLTECGVIADDEFKVLHEIHVKAAVGLVSSASVTVFETTLPNYAAELKRLKKGVKNANRKIDD